MFDIGWSEMAIIMLVALVVIGPRDLPRLARSLGQWVAKGRAMAREFQRSLEDLAREAELDDVKREIEKVGRTNIRKSIEKTIDPTGQLSRAFNPNAIESTKSKTPAKLATTAANGAATEPAAKPDVTTEPKAAAKLDLPTEPEAVKPGPAAKPKTTAKPKTATRAKTTAKPKTTTGTVPKPASSETTEAETMAEPR